MEGLETAQAALAVDAPNGVAPEVQVAFDAAWSVMAAARQAPAGGGAQHEPTTAAGRHNVHTLDDPCWTATKAALLSALPEADYRTWIAPLTLLHVEEALVVVGAANCFVQSELQSTYARVLQDAVEQAWTRTMAIEVVIELALAA